MQDNDLEEEAITGINVTPLVDIVLVLLIIFMVTARFISEPSFDIRLPKTSAKRGAQVTEQDVFLTMNSSGEIYLNNQPLSREMLAGRVQELLQQNPDLNLILRADRSLPHGDVVAVLDEIRNQGVKQFGIAVETQ